MWRGEDKHVTYSYDEYGRLTAYKPSSGPVAGVNLSYGYNSLGQKKEVKILDGSGGTVHDTTYDYSQNGSLRSINYDDSKVAEYLYNPVGLVSQIDFFSGGSATGAYDVYSYDTSDPRDLLKTITMHYKDTAGQPASSIIDYTDGNGHPNVDKAGNLLSMTDLAGHWAYTYDHGGRVSSIVPPSPVPEQGIGGSYGYNWLGQLTNPPAEPNHLEYNAAGLPSLWPGMYSYTYKSDGSPYQVKNPDGSLLLATYTYDPTGTPSEFTAEGKTTQVSWDADGAFLGYAETAGGTDTQSVLIDPTTGSVLIDNTSGSTLSYVCDQQGRTLSSASSGGRADYHSDAAGQLQASTGYDGRVGTRYTYGPDGRLVSTTDPSGLSGGRVQDGNGGPRAWVEGFSTPGLHGGFLNDMAMVYAGEKDQWNPVHLWDTGKFVWTLNMQREAAPWFIGHRKEIASEIVKGFVDSYTGIFQLDDLEKCGASSMAWAQTLTPLMKGAPSFMSRTVVIGENCLRTESAALFLDAGLYEPALGAGWTRPAQLAWNGGWAVKEMAKGSTFIDIGIDLGRTTRSPFYGLESALTKFYPLKVASPVISTTGVISITRHGKVISPTGYGKWWTQVK